MPRNRLRIFLLVTLLGAFANAQPVGTEFRVNAFTTGSQLDPHAAYTTDSQFVVVWESEDSNANFDAFGQAFSASGVPVGSPFRLSEWLDRFQGSARVASTGKGSFVVVWVDDALVLEQAAVMARLYTSATDQAPVPAGDAFRVSSYTTGTMSTPDVAIDGGGDFVVVWSHFGRDGSMDGVFGRRFSSTGAARGDDFQVNTYTTGRQWRPHVASDGSGNFVVSWEKAGPDGPDEIWARRYSSQGAALGEPFRVNADTDGVQSENAIAANAAGDFVIAWNGPAAGEDRKTLARRFSASGEPRGLDMVVSSAGGAEDGAAVAIDASGRTLFAWYAPVAFLTTPDVYARRFSGSGIPIETEFRVNSYTTGYQVFPSVASRPTGDFVVLWAGAGDGDDLGAFGQAYGGGTHGDANGDGVVNVTDVFYLINALFAGGAAPVGPTDANGDGVVDVLDVFYLVNHLFANGPAPV
jgi:hypothetical protein